MSKRKQQSLSRAFRRGNAILEFSTVLKQNVVVWKKHTNHKTGWKNRVKKYALVATMDEYCQNVALPIKNKSLPLVRIM